VSTALRVIARRLIAFAAVPLLLIAWCARPLVRFRLCVVGAHRFGHLALEPEMWLLNRALKPRTNAPYEVDIWSLGSRRVQSNQYLVQLWAQRLRRPPSWFVGALVRAGEMLPALALEQAEMSIHGPRNALDNMPRQCPAAEDFTPSEIAAMRNAGFDPREPYVALVVRDASHYAARGEQEERSTALLNADLSKFSPTCEYLVASGLQVIRLGGPSPQQLVSMDGCFDYANSHIRSPQLDVKLPFNCRFAIATQTGSDAVALLGRRPVLYVDVLRLSQFFLGTRLATWFPVQFADSQGTKPWSLERWCSSSLIAAKSPAAFVESGVEFRRCTEVELRDLVEDYVDELESGVNAEVLQIRGRVSASLQEATNPWGNERFGEISAPVSRRWLLDNRSWWLQAG